MKKNNGPEKSLDNDGNKSELKAVMGFKEAFATIVGTVIGSGVFFKATSVASVSSSPFLHLTAWILGGVLTLCAGLTVAELSAAIPKTGGMLYYIEYTYGKRMSFLLGWALTVIYIPACIGALSIIFSTQLVSLLSLNISDIMVKLIAVLTLTSLFLLNLLGARAGAIFQMISLIGKLVPIAAIVIVGWFRTESIDFSTWFASSGHIDEKNIFAIIGAGLLATMFAYDGWIHVGSVSGEIKNPKKVLPRAISLGIISIMVIYVSINAIYLKAMPLENLAGNEQAASQIATLIFGQTGGKIITIGILISVYGCINGFTLTGMRLPFAMAESGSFPFRKQLSYLTKKTQVPVVSGILLSFLSTVMIALGAFNTLTDMLIFVIWIFYVLIFLAVIILRKREPNLLRPYKVPGYPIIPIIAIIGGVFIIISTIILQFQLASIGIGVTLLGLPVYYYTNKRNTEKNI